MNCSCLICEPKDANKAKAEKEEKKKEADATQGGSCVWVGTGAKVAPQKVAKLHLIYCFAAKLSPPGYKEG